MVNTTLQKFIKNIDFEMVHTLADLVNYQVGQVVSKTLTQNSSVSLTMFAFDKDEEISFHDSSGDAMVIVLDGQGEVTIGSNKYIVNKGETIIMPAKIPHAVYAKEQFKMMLLVVFPQK
jgi:quercetin dioxygenase-like cupin family protein